MSKNDYTGLLYAQPSFTEGLARVLDLWGTFDDYNYSPNGEEADYVALASDWYAVGADLYHAISRFEANAGDLVPHDRTPYSR
jgi:hypothetical protein